MYIYLYLSNNNLKTNNKLIKLNHKTEKLQINYENRLITLIKKIKQLNKINFTIPAKIQHVYNTTQKFYKHKIILKQIKIQFFK